MKIILVMAVSADGKIAQSATQLSLDWTSKEDTKFFVQKTKEAGTVIMGRRTFETFGRPLKGRRLVVMCAPGETLPQNISEDGTVEFTHEQPRELVRRLEEESRAQDASGARAVLGGGATINGLFLEAGLIDEIFLTVEPVIFGSGLGVFEGAAAKSFAAKNNLKLKLAQIQNLSDNIINLHYIVEK